MRNPLFLLLAGSLYGQSVPPTPITNDVNNPPPQNGYPNYMVQPTARTLKVGCVYQDPAKTIPLPGVRYTFISKPRKERSGGHQHDGSGPMPQLFKTVPSQGFQTGSSIYGITETNGCGTIQMQFPDIAGWFTTTFTYTYLDSQGVSHTETAGVNEDAQTYYQPSLGSGQTWPLLELPNNPATMKPFFTDQFHTGSYAVQQNATASFLNLAINYHNRQATYFNGVTPTLDPVSGWSRLAIQTCSVDYGGIADNRYQWDGAWTPWAAPRAETHDKGFTCDYVNPNTDIFTVQSMAALAQQWFNAATVDANCFSGKYDRQANVLTGQDVYNYWPLQPYTHVVCGGRDSLPPVFPAPY